MSLRLLVTGARGQLGTTLVRLLEKRVDIDCRFADIDELDLCDSIAVNRFVTCFKPDYIINCAAYTAVDKAESDEDMAELLNAGAVANLAEAARACNARVVHVSTDYVFSGDGCRPLREDDIPSPRTAYGRTKLHGEQLLKKILPEDSVIIRTAWLYSPYGNNFVKTILRLSRERTEINVVDDQIGTPTSAQTLARAILSVIESDEWHPGLYHLTDGGVASWYDFAVAVLRMAKIQGCKVRPVATEEYSAVAVRPRYSLLSKKKFSSIFQFEINHWEDTLKTCIEQLNY